MDDERERFQPLEAELVPVDHGGGNMPAPTIDYRMFEVAHRLGERDLDRIKKKIIYEAAQCPGEMTYQWTAGGGSLIKGATIKLANIIARNFKWIAIDTQIVGENSREWKIKAVVVDFQEGQIYSRIFIQRKNQRAGGKMDEARAEDIAFQIGQSKSVRNVILNYAPPFIVDAAIEASEKGAIEEIRKMGLDTAIQKTLKFLSSFNIGADRVVAKYKKPLKEFTDYDVLGLWGDHAAIRDGQIGAEASFPEVKAEPKKEQPKKAPAAKKAEKAEPPKEEEAPLPEPPNGGQPTADDLFGDLEPEKNEPEPEEEAEGNPDIDIMRGDLEKEFGPERVEKYLDAVLEKGWKKSNNEERAAALRMCERAFAKLRKGVDEK